MKKKQVAGIVLAVAVLISGFPAGREMVQAKEQQIEDTWDGTVDTSWYKGHENESYFEISTAEQLAGMAQLSNVEKIGFGGKTIRLTADLDLAEREWIPIGLHGVNTSNSGSFEGILDGNHHVIRNLKATGQQRNGLFSSINRGSVQNLGIENATVIQGDTSLYQGILCAFASNNIRITNCYTTGSLTVTDDWTTAGGLIGFIAGGGRVIGCYSSAEIKAEKVTVAVDYDDITAGIGGIVGAWNNSHLSDSVISDCYFDGTIENATGTTLTGGILGLDYTSKNGKSGLTIRNCFAKPASLSVPLEPDNFAYIGLFNGIGQLSDCYYMKPDGQSEHYLPAMMLEKDNGSYDPFTEEDVEELDTMTGADIAEKLNEKASQSPRITWKEGPDHPLFSWDNRSIAASLAVTATASNASKALITALSDMDGTAAYAVVEEGMTEPSDVKELEAMVQSQEGTAQGTFDIKAGNMVTLSVEELKPDTGYTVFMAVKNPYELWSDLSIQHFRTVREALTGAAVLSGFPVSGEVITVELIGIQEDADPVFTWYRGKTIIDGESGSSYTLAEEDIGSVIRAEVSSAFYEGKVVSGATPKIAEEYEVTKIKVTKEPDKKVYGRDESFDRTGMEVTAYLKASASNATPSTAKKVLTDSEYDTDYDFGTAGKTKVQISYMGVDTELEVLVTEENLEGEVTLTGLPAVGETLSASLTGAQTNTKFIYSWYRDSIRVAGVTGSHYLIRKEDAGHRIRVEVTASSYGGKLVSDPTDTVQSGYVVSGIAVTKLPDKVVYNVGETFDGTGMEITVYMKVNALDSSAVAERILKPGEYEVSYDFNRKGTVQVAVIYRWNGAAYTDEFQVTVETGKKTGGSSGSSGSSTTGHTGVKPQPGIWRQTEEGVWKFEKSDGTFAASEWIYTANGAKSEWYHFDEGGRIQSGWFTEGSNWYYLNTNHDGSYGAMVTGWLLAEDGYWYYFDPQQGTMVTGWTLINGKWYNFNSAGYEKTWEADKDGNWKWTGSKAMPYGAMYADTVTPDGVRVGADGSRAE